MLCCFADLPPGYPYQSITAPFGSPFPPYRLPTPTGAIREVVPPHRSRSPAPGAPLPSTHRHTRLLEADVKPQSVEQPKTGSVLKQEPDLEQPLLGVTAEPLGPLHPSCSPVLPNQDREGNREAPEPQHQPLPLHAPSPPSQQFIRLEETREEEREAGQIKMEVSSYSCQAAYPLPPAPLPEAEPKSEVMEDQEQRQYPSCITASSDGQESAQTCVSVEQTTSVVSEPEQPGSPMNSHMPSQKETTMETSHYPPPISTSLLPLTIAPEDPMAGMLALLTASEMPEASFSAPPALSRIPHTEGPAVDTDCSSAGALEIVALEGIAMLSQMAQREVDRISQEQGKRGVDV